MEMKIWEIKELIKTNGGPWPISRSGLYKLVADGKIPYKKIGKRIFIPNWFVEEISTGGSRG